MDAQLRANARQNVTANRMELQQPQMMACGDSAQIAKLNLAAGSERLRPRCICTVGVALKI
ncbi:hypothetical protein HJFPF1_13299 [Paramyrothecium foliicola]|nr:hypothetical protein HJFPF1_13299 [Paramyrothecium foliicola]